MSNLLKYLVLPSEISAFERTYLARMNRVALVFFCAHVPVFMAVAAACNTGVTLAAALTSLVLVGPAVAYFTFVNPRHVSTVFGVTAMCMGGLLVHFGQGPMQIEMHFYFFVLLALLSVFANPLVVVVAAVTVAAHHALLFALLPRSVFNYDASVWAVVVHAAFVVLESIAACFVARSFFDNVIGLERIVEERTREVDVLNRDLQLVLDNVGQGFLTVDRAGKMSRERSSVVTQWFGPPTAASFFDYVGAHDAAFAEMLVVCWEDVFADVMPLEVVLANLPTRIRWGQGFIDVAYRPIMSQGVLDKVLIVMTDVTVAVERALREADQLETLETMKLISKDKGGFVDFLHETTAMVSRLASPESLDVAEVQRLVHTLKGNTALYGISSVSTQCNEFEECMSETGGGLTDQQKTALRLCWTHFEAKVDLLIGSGVIPAIQVARPEFESCLSALRGDAPRQSIADTMADWELEPTSRRLEQLATQARRLAERLGKGEIEVVVADNDEKLLARNWTGFWSAFSHMIRNAIDHGLETTAERSALGKPARGRIELCTRSTADAFFVEISDDGRGIDWAKVAASARRAGLPCTSAEDLTDAIFRDGVTTRESVSEISGRGVGMAAMRAACRALGGEVVISSDLGRGTTVRFCLPLEATGRRLVHAATPLFTPLAVGVA